MRIEANPPAATPTGNPIGLAASRDEFLRLFVAQLQNQNPLDPQSGADMVAQLAQFSGVEQQVETNRRLEDLTAAQDAAGSAGLANLVGRTVTADASQFTTDGRGPTPPITLDGDAVGGEVLVRDGNGAVVATAPIAPGPPPTVAWDGLNRDGAPLPAGAYTLEVAATDRGGAPITARPQFTATVDAVAFTADGQRLHLGHVRVTPGAVTTIANGGTSP